MPKAPSLSHRLKMILVTSLLTITVTGFAAYAVRQNIQSNKTAQTADGNFPQKFLKASRLWPRLRDAQAQLGERFIKAGQERLVLNGTMSRDGAAKSLVRIILERPGKVRVEEAGKASVFNGEGLVSSKTLNQADENELESLLYDTADHFFEGQKEGYATRFLGERFRANSTTSADYAGPFYDIYQVGDQVGLKKEKRIQTKLYLLNSDTLLLDRIRYETEQGTKIEVQLNNWQKSGDLIVPGEVVRFEDGRPVFTLTVVAATAGPKLSDGIFDKP